MIHSMTGYATQQGSLAGYRWSYELRSVNGKGFNVRLRVPEWIEGLETALRSRLEKVISRGTVNLGLRVTREDGEGALALNAGHLSVVLSALARAEKEADAAGLTLAPSTAADVLALRGVLEAQAAPEAPEELRAALLEDADALLEGFDAMRRGEGAALEAVLRDNLADIARLTETADTHLQTQRSKQDETFRRNLDRVLGATARADPVRVAQEIATLTISSDVREELDRLRAHTNATVALLDEGGRIGRKIDFLCIEFNREANTLCSKAQLPALSETGLALKVVIDQMREQVQNVE